MWRVWHYVGSNLRASDVNAMALTLGLPLELDYWYKIQYAAYGVILYTLVFQKG